MLCSRQRTLKLLVLVGLLLWFLADIALPQGAPYPLQRHIDNLSKKETIVRLTAAQSIGSLGSAAVAAIPDLITRLDTNSEVWSVKAASAQSLGKIGSAAAKLALPSLRAALESKHPEVVIAAATALGEILKGSGATKELDDCLVALVQLAKDSEEVRSAAKASVERIGSGAGPILLDFISKNSDQQMQRRFASQILADSTDLSLDQAISYRGLLKDSDAEVRSRFAAAVTKVVQGCALRGAPCLADLPKIQQLELDPPVDPALRQYEDGIKVCERHLNSIKADQALSVIQRFVVHFAIPLGLTVSVMIGALVFLVWRQSWKARALRREQVALSDQNWNLQSQLRAMVLDLNQKVNEISAQKAAKEHNEIARAVLKRFVTMPDFEDRLGFKIASSFRDSSDVSGDFYNWSSSPCLNRPIFRAI